MLCLFNYVEGGLGKLFKLSLPNMTFNLIFRTIIFVVICSISWTYSSYALCDADCNRNKFSSNNSYTLGNYSIPVLYSYEIAQAVIDTDQVGEDNKDGKETEVDIEAEPLEYDSLLLEAAKHANKQNGAASSAKDWSVFVAIYLWMSGLNGDLGVGNTSADLDVSFGDIWDNIDVGAQLHFEFWWKKWILFIDPSYVKLSTSNSQTNEPGSTRARSEVKQFYLEFAGGYRVAEIPLSSSPKSTNGHAWPQLNIDLYGGGRIYSLDTKIKITQDTPDGPIRQTFNRDKSWFDFIVGTRLLFNLTESLLFSAKTDVGGFGLGFSSDISWNLVTNIGYELPWWGVTPYIGYRVLYIDYQDGSGDNRFVYDVWQTGPQIGLGVQF